MKNFRGEQKERVPKILLDKLQGTGYIDMGYIIYRKLEMIPITNSTNYKDFLAEQLKDPEVKVEYDALESEFEIKRALIKARNVSGITQQELSKRTGINQSDISKLEQGKGNPSLKTLQRLAEGLGMRMEIKFVPVDRA